MTTSMLLGYKANAYVILQDSPFGYHKLSVRSVIPVAMDTKSHNYRICWPNGYRVFLLLESFTMDTAVHQIGTLDLAFNKPILYSYCAKVEVSGMSW
jgi:hypothetical protein